MTESAHVPREAPVGAAPVLERFAVELTGQEPDPALQGGWHIAIVNPQRRQATAGTVMVVDFDGQSFVGRVSACEHWFQVDSLPGKQFAGDASAWVGTVEAVLRSYLPASPAGGRP